MSKTEVPVAHLNENGSTHDLAEHLYQTARIAAAFAAEFGCGGWGSVAGLWHDLGKYSYQFQCYIRQGGPRTDHSSAGAIHAIQKLGAHGRILAYLIAGHHAGLPDWQDENEQGAT